MNKRKSQAVSLRNKGYSYNMISEKLGINKSTLSSWFRDMPFAPNKAVIERIKRGPFRSGQIRHDLRIKRTNQIKESAKKELGKIFKRDLQMLGLGLYIGEGSKIFEDVRIINSDPRVIKLAVKWFREIFNIESENLTLLIHLYPDNNLVECEKYWSKITGIPRHRFRKSQIDLRTNKSKVKKRQLPFGTASLSVIGNGNPNFGVNLHRRIMGWIESSFAQT